MMMIEENSKHKTLTVLPTGDPRSQFRERNANPKEILKRLGRPKYLLSSSYKVQKSNQFGYLTRVMYLSPGTTCPQASERCLATCLGHSSGRMGMSQATNARDQRTALYFDDRKAFIALLKENFHTLCYDAETHGLGPAVRLNGTSDIDWTKDHPEIFREFSHIQFYDYTKRKNIMLRYLQNRHDPKAWPSNYHLTFSRSEKTDDTTVKRILHLAGNVAVVFWPHLPAKLSLPYRVVDGDKNDCRFLDPEGVIVGLRAKGEIAQQDLAGFVIRTNEVLPQANLNSGFAA